MVLAPMTFIMLLVLVAVAINATTAFIQWLDETLFD